MFWKFFVVILLFISCMNPATDSSFDWQGHRGARGLAPENSIPGFLLALTFPEITTLEMDVVISADSQVVLSHEPWISHEICAQPDGQPVDSAEAQNLRIFDMTLDQIRRFDCGSRGHHRFAEQAAQKTHKPELGEVIRAVDTYCTANGRPIPAFNIELKSRPEWDGIYTPTPEVFSRLVMQRLDQLEVRGRTCIQSFDPRILQEIHRTDPDQVTAWLTESAAPPADQVQAIGFTPAIYSPYYPLVTREMVDWAHSQGMKLIPWTVNDPVEMKRLTDLGVDGIITDYPNRIPKTK